MRNHGLVCVGETVEEAFYYIYYAILACQNQVLYATINDVELFVLSAFVCAGGQIFCTINYCLEYFSIYERLKQ